MSPNLFKIYLHEARNKWSRNLLGMGIEMKETNCYILLFAEDLVTLANNEEDIP